MIKKDRGNTLAKGANSNRSKGTQYEERAAEYLEAQGFRIIQKNFSSRFGEIDLVAREGRYLVFIEVKYRATARGGHPLEAVDAGKRRRIRKTADFYCLRYGYGEDTPCRFDVVGVLGDEVIHVRDAFER